ncbi:M15 family metallopeptidase [Clostridium saudiense]|uniref:M15 family metallopeptidase n=1 Tax=Clostridium saudiense TaxID=1414720 RepID=UPI0012B8DE15|nr:M15 family metallopeptidase [Clostridium saudiense]MDU3523122.1 M15 family metallopeptidase [Clostridium saudiense]
MNNRKGFDKLKVMSCLVFIVVAVALGISNVSDNNIDRSESNVNSSDKSESVEDVNNKEVLLAKSKRKEMNNTFSSDADDLKNDEIEKLQDILNDELFILVNKNNKLAIDYEPNTLVDSDIAFEEYIDCKQLDERTSNAAKEMFNAALKENINLIAISGYRSYSVQENLYNSRVEVKGIEKTRQYTAEPGASEHQTGLAIDIVCNDYPYLDEEFENTDAFKWLFNNCYKYGFILRYQKGKEDITGYNYEPWHFRYIGDVDIAKDIMERGICFEEFIDEVNSKIEELQGMDN